MSASVYLIGIDQGTQSTKSVIYNQLGEEIATAMHPVKLNHLPEGLITQSPDEIYHSVVMSIKSAMCEAEIPPEKVAALSIDSQICSMVVIDENWQPLFDVISHLDIASNKNRDVILQKFGERIISQNGSMPYIAARLLWLKQSKPDLFEKVARVLLVGAFIGGKLCNLKAENAFVDETTMNVFGWGNLPEGTWDAELANSLGIDPVISPVIRSPIEVIGGLRKGAAKNCGLLSGTPVLVGAGDAVAGWFGLGADRPGFLVDTSGTANHLCICIDQFKPDLDEKILSFYPSLTPNLGHQIGFTAGTGRSHSWFVNLLNSYSPNRIPSQSDMDVHYRALEVEAAEIPPGSDGVMFLPHFGGRFCPLQPSLRGGWLGLEWRHTQANLYRAILESIAYEYSIYLRTAQELYPKMDLECIYSIGGGAKSDLWSQIKADVLGLPVRVIPGASNFAARGSAMLAAIATGNAQFFKPARFENRAVEFVPNSEQHQNYQLLVDPYLKFNEQLNLLYLEREQSQVL